MEGSKIMLDSIKGSKKSVGIKQTTKALINDEVIYLIIAKDADTKILKDILAISSQKGIEVYYVDNMKQLGKMAGIAVGAAVVALLK